MCGYVPPAQNSFKPNVMNRYIHDTTKEVVILNDNVEHIDIPNKGPYTREDLYGRGKQSAPVLVSKLPPPPATVMQPKVVQAQTVIPAREIPAAMIKTPAEVAATPKAAVTATVSDIVTP